MTTKPKAQVEADIITALVCDGVRKEVSGQDIVIGVYSDVLNIPQLPSHIVLTLYLRIRFKRTGQTKFEFRVMGESGIQILPVLPFDITPLQTGRIITVVMGPLPIAIQTFGKITFELKFPNADWEPVTDITFVKIADATDAKASQPTDRPNV
jgi:hypothetical protein